MSGASAATASSAGRRPSRTRRWRGDLSGEAAEPRPRPSQAAPRAAGRHLGPRAGASSWLVIWRFKPSCAVPPCPASGRAAAADMAADDPGLTLSQLSAMPSVLPPSATVEPLGDGLALRRGSRRRAGRIGPRPALPIASVPDRTPSGIWTSIEAAMPDNALIRRTPHRQAGHRAVIQFKWARRRPRDDSLMPRRRRPWLLRRAGPGAVRGDHLASLRCRRIGASRRMAIVSHRLLP